MNEHPAKDESPHETAPPSLPRVSRFRVRLRPSRAQRRAVVLLLALLVLAAVPVYRFSTEVDILWRGPPALDTWLAPQGAYAFVEDGVRRVDGAGKSSLVIHRERSEHVAEGATAPGGDVGVLYYHDEGLLGSLRLSRFDASGQLRFDIALDDRRDLTCGTGRIQPKLSLGDDDTWVIDRVRSPSHAGTFEPDLLVVRRFGLDGKQLSQAPVCGANSCYVTQLWSGPKGAAVHHGRWKETASEHYYALSWFSPDGAALARNALGTAKLDAATMAADGSLFGVQSRAELCGVRESALVRLDPTGCRGSVPLSFLKPEQAALATASDGNQVTLITQAVPERSQRWLHGWPRSAVQGTLHAFEHDDRRIRAVVARRRSFDLGELARRGEARWADGRLLFVHDSVASSVSRLMALDF